MTMDVLGLGCIAVDELLYVDAYPAADSKMPVRRWERQCGGLTATVLVAAARLGAERHTPAAWVRMNSRGSHWNVSCGKASICRTFGPAMPSRSIAR